MRTYIIGNCPSVHFVQEHAPDAEGFKGSKVFAFRAQWLEGELSMAKKYGVCLNISRFVIVPACMFGCIHAYLSVRLNVDVVPFAAVMAMVVMVTSTYACDCTSF